MNVNAFLQKDYENETTLRPKKTNPNKPNFKRAKMNKKSLAGKSGHTFQQTKKKSGQSRMKWLKLQFWMNCQFQTYVN